MTRDDIIRMAREAGWTEYSLLHAVELQRLETFAALGAAHEREACAKVCEWESARLEQWHPREALAVGICAAAIRARGEP